MWFLFDVAITNSYILCKLHTDLKYTNSKDFRVDFAKELIGNSAGKGLVAHHPNQPKNASVRHITPQKVQNHVVAITA